MSGDIVINGQAAIVGPDDVLVIAMSADDALTTALEAFTATLTERLGNRWVVITGPGQIVVMPAASVPEIATSPTQGRPT